jgi:hypothetical protein
MKIGLNGLGSLSKNYLLRGLIDSTKKCQLFTITTIESDIRFNSTTGSRFRFKNLCGGRFDLKSGMIFILIGLSMSTDITIRSEAQQAVQDPQSEQTLTEARKEGVKLLPRAF